MNSKNFKAILFVLIFLASKVGLALNVHYCGGHIAEIELAWKVEGCGMFSEKIEDKDQAISILKKHKHLKQNQTSELKQIHINVEFYILQKLF